MQDDGSTNTGQDRRHQADVYRLFQVTPIRLAQDGQNDPNDKGRFDAFADHDDE